MDELNKGVNLSGKKYMIYLWVSFGVVFLIIFGFLMLTFKNIDSNNGIDKTLEDCLINNEQGDICFGLMGENVAVCNGFIGQIKDRCFSMFVEKFGDWNICDRIKNYTVRVECLSNPILRNIGEEE
jgi:hypothetical protein